MSDKTRKKRIFWPPKYYRGLTKSAQAKRKAEIRKFGALDWKDPKAYVGFKTNQGRKTRKSSYTATWNRMFPGVKSLADKAALTGVPEDLLRESYNRGMAAWRTGHRPGATQQQWGYARVSSLLLLGKTAKTTDSDLVSKAKERSAKARAWFRKMEKESPVRF
jgi:hypothetical protein